MYSPDPALAVGHLRPVGGAGHGVGTATATPALDSRVAARREAHPPRTSSRVALVQKPSVRSVRTGCRECPSRSLYSGCVSPTRALGRRQILGLGHPFGDRALSDRMGGTARQ